ncbi:hypothetical protein K1X76_08165 [bacterium]|nr:hypothetical protein [bacterium]
MRTIIILVSLLFIAFNAHAVTWPMTIKGRISRVEKGLYHTNCFFVEDGQLEEMALWPQDKIKCEPLIGKNINATINHEKVKIEGEYGTLDVLWLTNAEVIK